MPNSIPRVLFISGSDPNWLWLSDAIGERFMLVRESGSFQEIAKRVSLVSPTMAVVDFSPQVGLDPALIVRELIDLAPDLPVLALGSKDSSDALVTALRAGVKDFIDLSATGGEVTKIMMAIAQRAPARKDESSGRAIVVLGARQGVGATTLAVNLATEMGRKDKDHTLLLDFGLPLGDGLIHLPCEEKQGAMDFVECVRSLKRFDASLAKTAFRRHPETGVAILSLPRNLADLRDISASDGLKFVNLIKSFFSNIVIDLCGFSNLDFVASLLRSADSTVIVTPQNVPGVVTAAEQIKALADKGVKSAEFNLVVSPHLKDIALSPESIADKLGLKKVYTLPNRAVQLTNAVNDGTVLTLQDSRDPYSKAVAALAKDIAKPPATPTDKKDNEGAGLTDKLRGLFKR